MKRWFLALLGVASIAADPVPLRTGEILPALSGETLYGKPLELPASGAGSNRVLVFSFSKAASEDSRLWSDQLAKDFNANSAVIDFGVMMLESVPRLVRGMAEAGIKSGIPKALWDKTILVMKNEEFWKKGLAVSTDKHSYVVLIDAGGRLRWVSSGPFAPSEYAQLKKALAQLASVN